MDRAERRFRTERVIARRVRRRKEVSHRLYLDRPPEPWRSAHILEVEVGHEKRWTFCEWVAKPGVLRKHNGAHGSCFGERDENLTKDQPSLEWELENLALARIPPEAESRAPAMQRSRRKNTKRAKSISSFDSRGINSDQR